MSSLKNSHDPSWHGKKPHSEAVNKQVDQLTKEELDRSCASDCKAHRATLKGLLLMRDKKA